MTNKELEAIKAMRTAKIDPDIDYVSLPLTKLDDLIAEVERLRGLVGTRAYEPPDEKKWNKEVSE